VQKKCCIDGDKNCPLFSTCGYQKQFAAAPQVWVVAANLLFFAQELIPPPTIVVIDESFWRAGLRRFEDRETGVAKPLPLGAIVGGGRLSTLRRKLNRALCAQTERVEGLDIRGQQIGVERGSLERALTVEECIFARNQEYRYLPRPEMYPGMPRDRLRRIDKKSVEHSRRNIAVWEAVIDLLISDQPVSGRLCLTLDDDGLAAVCVNTVASINPQWRAPTLILDATLPGIEILKAYYPTVKIVGDIYVRAPHARVRQIVGAPTTAKKLIGIGEPRKTVERNRKRVLHHILKRNIDVGRAETLVVAQKGYADWLRQQQLPDNIHIAHFNALSGLDEFRDVRLLIVDGRTAPPPAVIEPLAGALSGVPAPTVLKPTQYQNAKQIAPAQWWWHRISHEPEPGVCIKCDHHPDPLVEDLRWQSCEANELQAIGRARAINRTVADPVDIDILADVRLPIRLDDVERWQEPSAFAVMLATEGIVLNSPIDMVKVRPDLWASSRTAERAVREVGGSRHFPLEDYNRDLAGTFSRLRYRPTGNGQKWRRAWYDPAILPDPRGWLERKLERQIIMQRQ
jgi:putative DNA primase/helicase